ncbi:MAG: LysM peptidoglycan-binding domain-containing protein, partial [Capnocytophaga ochracea]
SVQGQKRYVVKPQETLWRIAKNHNVSVEELEKLNKNEKGFNPNSIREGQEIWVPASSTDSTEPEPPARPNTKKEVVLYLVERGEGFYSLERKFGLSEAELVKLNPSLKDGLKSDAQIWIPKENYEQYKSASLNNTANYNFQNSNNTLRSASSPANVKEISYILPFKLSDVSTGQIAIIKSRLTENKLTPVATDFYSGALIALDSLQKMGYKFKVNVYDSEGDLKKIASNASVQNSQVVIGPFTTKSFNTLASLVTSNNTILLAPLSNKNITLNPNVYQTLPNDEVLQAQMIDYLNKNYSDENMIILADSKNSSLREKLERSFPNAKVVTEMSANGFVNALNYNKENVVLLQSNDIGYVSMAVRLLHNALKSKRNNTFPKIMLATVDRGSVYDSNNLSNNQLSDLRFTYPTVNKYSNGTDSFSARYLKTYGILPNKYAIRGFDLTMDAVLRLGVSGNLTSANTRIGETSYLENKFAYLKNFYKGGGYENQGVYIVQYDNMEVKELK